jgi:hypothetical protein
MSRSSLRMVRMLWLAEPLSESLLDDFFLGDGGGGVFFIIKENNKLNRKYSDLPLRAPPLGLAGTDRDRHDHQLGRDG